MNAMDPTAPVDHPAKSRTEAPTSGITKTASEMQQAVAATLTETEYDFVNLIHQHYFINGSVPTAELAKEKYGIDPDRFSDLIDSVAVRSALFERNVIFPIEVAADEEWRTKALTAEQLIVADTMLDLNDSRSYKKKLQDLGVSTKKWQAWMADPIFAGYLRDHTHAVLKNGMHEASLALMDKVQQGDLAALKLYWEYMGHWVPASSSQTAGALVGSPDQTRELIRAFVNIVVEEIDDHQLASKIADRIRQLAMQEHVMHTIDSDKMEILQPEVVPTRELTEKMQNSGMAL